MGKMFKKSLLLFLPTLWNKSEVLLQSYHQDKLNFTTQRLLSIRRELAEYIWLSDILTSFE
jgi:hypothetical protein